MKIIGIIIGTAVSLFAAWLILYVLIFGFHMNTGSGKHTGYITAVEKTGIFFKTGRAYLKSDAQSSQEDNYCVMDENIFKQLEEASKLKKLVTVSHISYLSAGIKNCEAEGAIIISIE